jgi:hypothetical protein
MCCIDRLNPPPEDASGLQPKRTDKEDTTFSFVQGLAILLAPSKLHPMSKHPIKSKSF